MSRSILLALPVILAVLGLAACDPVHSDAVADLGPEVDGVGPGPDHRPGQPCVTCHGGSGPGSPQWSVAGTVYATEGQPAPLVGGQVILTDATGATRTVTTNQVGNFYIPVDDWAPAYPLHVSVENGAGDQVNVMTSRINGSGSCADCHLQTGSYDRVPAVYLVDGGS